MPSAVSPCNYPLTAERARVGPSRAGRAQRGRERPVARLATLSGPLAPQALALNTSGTYLGVSLGGLLGGRALTGWGSGALPPLAVACTVLALVLLSNASEPARRTPARK